MFYAQCFGRKLWTNTRNLSRSWRSTFARLTSPSPLCPTAVTSLSNYLTSPTSIEILSNCYEPFPPPSAASKTDFEKRTAPINFTAADQPNGGNASTESVYTLPPIGELKEAALELSKSLNIDEVGALRIVVLEYQDRPAVSLRSATTGGANGADEAFGGNMEDPLKASQLISDAEKKENLFMSRVGVYVKERRYAIKTAAFLVRAAMGANRKENMWRDAGRKFVAEGIVKKGGIGPKIVQSITSRWEVGKDGVGQPDWVRSRLNSREIGEMLAYEWEQQVRFRSYYICFGSPKH
jgi:nuclear pore complex protein Nup188